MAGSRLITVEPVLFGFMLCVFLAFPVQEQLVYKKLCNSNYNNTICNNIKGDKKLEHEENVVQSLTSKWLLYLNMASTFPSMLAATTIGPCSDKVGRKFFMILPLVGNAINAASMIANSYYDQWPVAYMLFGSIVSGFFGNFAMVLMAVFAYLSDITTEKSRTLRLTLLESMTFVGGCVGELISGVMVDHVGYYITFCLVLGILILTLLYVGLFLEESYFPDDKIAITEICSFSKFEFGSSMRFFSRKRENNQRARLLILLASFYFVLWVFTGFGTVKILFALKRPLSFSSSMLGYFLSVSFLYRGVGVLIGAPIFTRVLHFSDYTMIIIGCVGSILSFVALALSTKTWMLFAVPVLDSFGGVAVPCIRSLMSKASGKEEQGVLFSAIAAVEVACSLVASVSFNNIYSATVAWHPGFAFYMMGLVLVFPILLTLSLKRMDSSAKYEEFKSENAEVRGIADGLDPNSGDASFNSSIQKINS